MVADRTDQRRSDLRLDGIPRDRPVRNLATVFNALIVPAAIALFLLGEVPRGGAVSGMAVINTLIGLAQEIRAKRHLDRLAILVETQASAYAGTAWIRSSPAGEWCLAIDVLLAPASRRCRRQAGRGSFLEWTRVLLTGESDPVPRERRRPLLSGSFCVAGRRRYPAREGRRGVVRPEQSSAQARRYDVLAQPACNAALDGSSAC